MSPTTEERIKTFLVTNFYVADANALGPDDSLLDAGIVDSTGVLEVISFIEDEFGIKVEDSEMLPENLDSIHKLAAFIARKTSG